MKNLLKLTFLISIFSWSCASSAYGPPGDKESGNPFVPCISMLLPNSETKLEFEYVADVVGYIRNSDHSFKEKQYIWRTSVERIKKERWFISLEIKFKSEGFTGVAYMGGAAGGDKTTLMVLLEDGTTLAKPNSGGLLNWVYNYKVDSDQITIPMGSEMNFFVKELKKILGEL